MIDVVAAFVVGIMAGGGVTWAKYPQVNEAVEEWRERLYGY